jgi:prevent-host-death family protein
MNQPISTTLTVSDARIHLYDMMEEVQKYLRRFVITHHGKPQAVLMPVEDLESWEETLDIMSNKKLMADIRQAEKDYKAGKYYTLEEVEKELGISTK